MYIFSSGIPFQDGLWHQAGFVFDSGLLTFYFDGVQLGGQHTVGSSTVAEQTNNWSLLNSSIPLGDEYFDNGDYDEAALWNRALSGEEMSLLYSQGLAVAAVPEPTSFGLMLVISTIGLARRKRRRNPAVESASDPP